MLQKWLGGGAAAIVLIAVEFWLIHAGHDARRSDPAQSTSVMSNVRANKDGEHR
jgi:hypothetical protein